MPIHTGRLVLAPRDALEAPNGVLLRAGLADAGFIGMALADNDAAYVVGERFLQLITFAGCSVQLELAPTTCGDPFCHIRFAGPFDQPRLLRGRNTRPPRCAICRAPLKDWMQRLQAHNGAHSPRLRCDACGAGHPPWEWDWKENAGYGRLFVQVEEIFPGEATPTPELISILRKITDTGWRHFYVQDP